MIRSTRQLGWRPGLDGLRAIAVLLVALYHANTKVWFPGGLFGVDLFLVLSGFLITTLLIEEWNGTGSISLRRFYTRRALRLYPAAVVFCLVYLAIRLVFLGSPVTGNTDPGHLATSVALAIGYMFNWAVALGYSSPTEFTHLWSLSLEEQFYLLWPGGVLLVLRRGLSLRTLLGLSVVLIVASASVPYVFPDLPEKRYYFASDFRAHELLIGASLALLYAGGWLRPAHARMPLARAAVALAVCYFGYLLLAGNSEFMYRGGFLLLAIACATIVFYAAFSESGVVSRVLGSRVLVYVGRRSYAFYLWHLPIAYWLRWLDPLPHIVILVALSLLAAELSFRLVEQGPLRLKARFAVSHAAKAPNMNARLPGVSLRPSESEIA